MSRQTDQNGMHMGDDEDGEIEQRDDDEYDDSEDGKQSSSLPEEQGEEDMEDQLD